MVQVVRAWMADKLSVQMMMCFFLCFEVVASVPYSREFCLEDAAVIRELEVSFFQHGVVVVCSDDVARSASLILYSHPLYYQFWIQRCSK
jgi:hypothetical protein